MKSPLWRYFRVSSALALLTSWAGYPKCQFCCGGCSGHCRLFMSIQVLHPLRAKTNSLTVMTTKNIFRHCQLSPQWGSMEDKYHTLLRITEIFWYLQWYKYYHLTYLSQYDNLSIFCITQTIWFSSTSGCIFNLPYTISSLFLIIRHWSLTIFAYI